MRGCPVRRSGKLYCYKGEKKTLGQIACETDIPLSHLKKAVQKCDIQTVVDHCAGKKFRRSGRTAVKHKEDKKLGLCGITECQTPAVHGSWLCEKHRELWNKRK